MTDSNQPVRTPVKKEFLLLLLRSIEESGENIKQIADSFKFSKQRLNYHLRKLRLASLIQKTQGYPYAIYSLTLLGLRVKKILGQSENVPNLWRCHALITGFEIRDFGKFDWKRYKIKQMNNWHYAEEFITDSYGTWKINIQSSGLLKIYCPEIYHENPLQAFGIMYNVSSKIARKYEEIYHMDIGQMRIIREGHKELADSKLLGELFGKTRIGNVWADASTGTMCLEESQSSDKIEGLLDAPKRLEKIEELLIKTFNNFDIYNQNIMKHLEVLSNINTAVFELRDAVRGLKRGNG